MSSLQKVIKLFCLSVNFLAFTQKIDIHLPIDEFKKVINERSLEACDFWFFDSHPVYNQIPEMVKNLYDEISFDDLEQNRCIKEKIIFLIMHKAAIDDCDDIDFDSQGLEINITKEVDRVIALIIESKRPKFCIIL